MTFQIVMDHSQLRLHIPDAKDLLQAIDLVQVRQLSFWDATILQSAQSLGCQLLISEDLGHGQKIGNVLVQNPFDEK